MPSGLSDSRILYMLYESSQGQGEMASQLSMNGL